MIIDQSRLQHAGMLLCIRRGQNPHAMVAMPQKPSASGSSIGTYELVPAWVVAKLEVEAAAEVMAVMMEAVVLQIVAPGMVPQ